MRMRRCPVRGVNSLGVDTFPGADSVAVQTARVGGESEPGPRVACSGLRPGSAASRAGVVLSVLCTASDFRG